MPRLNKIARNINVGLATMVDFLHKKGFNDIQNDPNAKVSDEVYALLWKEFGHGPMPDLGAKEVPAPAAPVAPAAPAAPEAVKAPDVVKAPAAPAKPTVSEEAPKPAPKPEPKPEPKVEVKADVKVDVKADVKVEAPAPAPEKAEMIKEVSKPEAPAPQKEEPAKPGVTTLGHIDLKAMEKKAAKPAKSEVKETKPAPKAEAVKPEPQPEKAPTPAPAAPVAPVAEPAKSETEIPQAAPVAETAPQAAPAAVEPAPAASPASPIKVVGAIDLSAINQYTRPKKKSKQERQKEAEERRNRNAAGQPQANGTPTGSTEANGEGGAKKKRNRIRDGKVKVDINEYAQRNPYPGNDRNAKNDHGKKNNGNKKSSGKPEVDSDDVSRQVKETLSRLSAKPKKGVNYRREKREDLNKRMMEQQEMEARESTVLKLTEFVTVNDLANMMNISVIQVISKCMEMGQMVSINQRLDAETINIVADEFGFTTEFVSADVVQGIQEEEDKEEDLVPRSPIITVMGHVDHGKTSLLDYIRNTNVIAGEAGGITQHIGAYSVRLEDGREITFLDTPGHEAFTAMRARGAKMTDIAIIVVAADDSVMPQTVEAINHASIAGVPIVFAINKIDKPGADPERIKQKLSEMNYLVEDWGGKYQSQDISAKKGINVKELLDKVLLEAELLDLKANPKRRALGTIVESSLDKGRGYVATVLVQNGTLHIGDIMVAGVCHGRVKAMFNERGQKIKQAGPGQPALILGLNGAPQAGDTFNCMETEQEAREVANKREQLQREQGLRTNKMLTLAEIGRRIQVGNFKELNIIVKGDVDGSVEALSDSLIKMSTEQIQVNVIHKAVGQISESDVTLASASDAIIVGFQVRPSLPARRMAENQGVEIRLYSIIYDAIEEIKAAMEGMLAPELKEEITGTAEVREVFKISKVGTVAGCMVKDGKIKRGTKVRLIRDGIVVYTGVLDSLKRFKDDAREVNTGFECGMSIAGYGDIKVGDFIEAYEEHEVKQTL